MSQGEFGKIVFGELIGHRCNVWKKLHVAKSPIYKLHMVHKLAKHHIESFDFACGEGLIKLIEDIPPLEFELPDGSLCTLKFEDAYIGMPSYTNKSLTHGVMKVLPRECRLSRTTYSGDLKINISWYQNGQFKGSLSRLIGKMPIMIKSRHCHLSKLESEEELMKVQEEFSEFGGYFIVNGIEKLIRPILIPRRNFPIALIRPNWKKNGICFTEYGLTVYSVRNEHTYANFIMHYLNNGSIMLSLFFQNQKFLLPLIPVLKALSNLTDKALFGELSKGSTSLDGNEEKVYRSCCLNMLRKASAATHESLGPNFKVGFIRSEAQRALCLIGSQFRKKILASINRHLALLHPVNVEKYLKTSAGTGAAIDGKPDLKEIENEILGQYLLQQSLLINLEEGMDKFYFLCYMTRKLFAFAKHRCMPETVDGPMMQEVLLPGQIFLVLLKQKLTDWLQKLKMVMLKKLDLSAKKTPKTKDNGARTSGTLATPLKQESTEDIKEAVTLPIAIKSVYEELLAPQLISQCLSSVSPITRPIEYFYSTGNLVLKEATSIQQTAGFTIIAEKINYLRYLSHFRSIHRGSHFAKTRISSIRKLTPDSWGYLCAVHTPDGAPCGLLNHITATCEIVSSPVSFKSLAQSQDATNRRVTFSATKAEPAPQDHKEELDYIPYDEFFRRILGCLRCVMFVKQEADCINPGHSCKLPDQSLELDPSNKQNFGVPSERHTGLYHYPVFLDSKLVGWVPEPAASLLETRLRTLKSQRKKTLVKSENPQSQLESLLELPYNLEIVFIRRKEFNAQFPGFFIFSTFSRLIRPVKNLTTNEVEYVGSFEQIYLHIVVEKSEITAQTNHMELTPTAFLSLTANLIPFSDFNQSPRNIYQCQMCKQTMGTTHYSLPFKAENKSYRLQNPQAPMIRCASADADNWIQEYPSGTNAIVAVISYTGYDMEDAMVINRASEQRGLAHGFVYKTEVLDLSEVIAPSSSFDKPNDLGSATALKPKRDHTCLIFGFEPTHLDSRHKPASVIAEECSSLDPDGLPHVGALISEGTPYYSYINILTGLCHVVRYKGSESFVVDQVYLIGDDEGLPGLRKALIYLRMRRNATIGDKFASRQGQKGICSYKLAQENMPFTESGLVPDIIFNPHGFPSRMTIGMMIECMAGKSSALLGEKYDATPFKFDEKTQASKYFGELLAKSGYDYYGTEIMYSGNNGRMLEVDIFFGVIYYQRLRHMVADKYQVRTTGPVDNLTHQPLKGRKRAGGIRCGEMERDALIAHGASFLLQDRLLHCSDVCYAEVCIKCKSLLSPTHVKRQEDELLIMGGSVNKRNGSSTLTGGGIKKCMLCGGACVTVRIPYVLKYLLYELLALNIKLELDVRSIC